MDLKKFYLGKRLFINLHIAIGSLSNFKLRTALAILGVFLGTFSLILSTNLSDALALKTANDIKSFGENLLIVRSGLVRSFISGARLMSEANTLTLDDCKAIKDSTVNVLAVSPSAHKSFALRYGNTTLASTLVTGVTASFEEIRNFKAELGRFITDKDNEAKERVAVLGRTVAERLFGDENPIGKVFLIFRVPFTVVGVMEAKGVDISNVDQDNQVFVPLNTFLKVLTNRTFINTIYVQTISEEAMASAKAEVESVLRKMHRISQGKPDDFTVINMKDVTALKSQTMSMINLLGTLSSGISFMIGGIGILSIMILIVSERKVEIGIRRAVGSRKKDIIGQFLLESSFISSVGGIIGVVAGVLVSVTVFYIGQLPYSISWQGLIIALIASFLVGMLAGFYPSYKASLIQPVEVIKA